MAKIKGNANLIQNFQIVLDDGISHSIIVDLPKDDGANLGPTSLHLCVMSHAGCYATIFALCAKKMRIPIKALKVKVEALKPKEAGTITEESFQITIKADAPKDRILRAHNITLKTCPVGLIFEKAGIKASYKLEIEGKQARKDD